MEQSENNIKNKSNRKNEKRKYAYSIFSVLIICIGVCVVTGCFKSPKVQSVKIKKTHKQDYSILINQWNKAVISGDLSDDYLLSREDNNEVIQKLNSLLQPFNNTKKMKSYIIDSEKLLYIPNYKYVEFLKESIVNYSIDFDIKMDEESIINELKRITNSRYLDKDMLLKIAYLNSFELYFSKHVKEFYRDGFTRNIRKFGEYQRVILAD